VGVDLFFAGTDTHFGTGGTTIKGNVFIPRQDCFTFLAFFLLLFQRITSASPITVFLIFTFPQVPVSIGTRFGGTFGG